MTPRKHRSFRIDDELLDGMQAVWERDGIQIAEQVRRAIRAWLDTKGIAPQRAERKRASTRKRS